MMPASNLLPKDGAKQETLKPNPTTPQEQLKCPRCDSSNTKFCYFNNYSLAQPRHFCKTCRRYWTKGGALRNVPIGGGCRKAKKTSKSTLKFGDDSRDSSELCPGGLSPAMGFGGFSFWPVVSNFSSSGDMFGGYPACVAIGNPCLSFVDPPVVSADQSLMGFNASHGSASSIESLSSLNQDLHWKLQQQRLAMLFGADHLKDGSFHESVSAIRPQPILYQNLEGSKADAYDYHHFKNHGSSHDAVTTGALSGNTSGSLITGNPVHIVCEDANPRNWNSFHTWGTTDLN